MTDIIEIITAKIGAKAVMSGGDVSSRAISYWDSAPVQAKAICKPASTQDVSEILKICSQYKQTVVTHGGRTTCVQGTNSAPNDIVISLERMTRISDIDLVGNTITVEAGAILEKVQTAVLEHDRILPLDLGARGSCTIGGNLSTNAGGINVIRYGMARAITLGLEAVLPDGTIISSMNKMLKNNAGYDLKQLFIGTEGTLGIITKAVLRLEPKPLSKNTALIALSGFASVPRLLNHFKTYLSGSLSAFEIMWGAYFQAVTETGWHKAPMERHHPFYVLLECDGADPVRDNDRFMEVIEQAFQADIIIDAILPKSELERKNLWNIRDDFEAILSPKPVYLYDVSLPISSMEQYVETVQAKLLKYLPKAKLYTLGHIGDGNLHFFVQAPSKLENTRRLSDISIYEPLKEFKGSVSAEHGIGLEKKEWLQQSRSADEIALMRLLKQTLDPQNLLNPNLIFD